MTLSRLIHAAVCMVFGYSAFLAFMVLQNFPSAILAIISGVTDNVLFFLHYLHRFRELRLWYTNKDLRLICRLGILIFTAGLLNLGYHTTIQIMLQKQILPVAQSSVIPIVWSVIVIRSGILLVYYCVSYQNVDDANLIGEEQEDGETEPIASNNIRRY